tara:strand:- start:18598 stop:19578 length:981 start_codon:yes stop_codon:yes gene_type:complete
MKKRKNTDPKESGKASPKDNRLTVHSLTDPDQKGRFSQPDPWIELKQFTAARIALGRTGHSQRTKDLLRFQLDHSMARDAIHGQLDVTALESDLSSLNLPIIRLKSSARDRNEYLKRPDLGRKLSPDSRNTLEEYAKRFQSPARSSETPPKDKESQALRNSKENKGTPKRGESIVEHTAQGQPERTIVFVIADGLSARAVQENAAPFLEAYTEIAGRTGPGPLCIVEQGRVAIGDPIGEILGAAMVVVLIGERPGLSSPDSMGLYMTYEPRAGTTDESRNCISNIRPDGLPPREAAKRFHYLSSRSLSRKLSGVFLKDDWTPELEE